MKILGMVLLLSLAITSCGEKEVLRESTKESDSGRVVEELEVPEGYGEDQQRIAEALGVGIGDLIKCGRSVMLMEGSPEWIVCYDQAGRFTHAILFRWSDYDQHPSLPNPRPIVEGEKRTLKVFRETVQKNVLRRVELNADEIARELEEIERYLIGFVGEEKYGFYYRGGKPDETEPEPEVDPNDPFAPKPPLTAEQMREIVNRLNHQEARSIARLFRHYREMAKEAEGTGGKHD